jgi:acyl carrier protein
VFPDLSPAEIPRASTSTVSAWDSIASVTLVSLIEEEFGLQIALDELEELTSFELVLSVVDELLAAENR